jgi:hypothetical protein
MSNPYARWVARWEHRLANRDDNRLVRPFEWGLEWLGLEAEGRAAIAAATQRWLADSDAFYARCPVRDYRLDGSHLTFTSPLHTPYPENNVVHADYFPVPGDSPAVLVLPQWNSDAQGHIGLCKLLNRFGVTALRMSLAYHDRRMPSELSRADYHVSANIGRTIHACRQSVMDARACLDWLESRGHPRLAILGTSLGSCMAFIVTAHDRRITVAIYNHASMYFGDVVWTGLATAHIRRGLETALTQDQVRDCWRVISPACYLDRLIGRDVRSLIVWGRYDTSFLPCYTSEVIEGFRSRGLHLETRLLPCGHYTTGQFPFNLMDGFAMSRFARRNL